MYIGKQNREINCPRCKLSFDVSADLSWIPAKPYFYQLANGRKEAAHTKKSWCRRCEQPTDCERLPNVKTMRDDLYKLTQEAHALQAKIFSFTKSNQQQLSKIESQKEYLESQLSIFSRRKSPERCLECGATELIEIDLPSFCANTRRKISFLHPDCAEPMTLIDGKETSLRFTMTGSPREIAEEKAVMLTREGELIESRPNRKEHINFDQRLNHLDALEQAANKARAISDKDLGAKIYEELMERVLPEAQKLVETRPQLAKAHQYFGRTCRILEFYDSAVIAFEKCIELDPDNYMAHAEIILCLGTLGHYSRARPFAEMAVKLWPKGGGAWSNLAMILYELGDTKTARQHVLRAMELDPSDPSVRHAYSFIIG